jgi:hypothetical protein
MRDQYCCRQKGGPAFYLPRRLAGHGYTRPSRIPPSRRSSSSAGCRSSGSLLIHFWLEQGRLITVTIYSIRRQVLPVSCKFPSVLPTPLFLLSYLTFSSVGRIPFSSVLCCGQGEAAPLHCSIPRQEYRRQHSALRRHK